MTGWGLGDVMALEIEELCFWMLEAKEFQKKIDKATKQASKR